MHFLLKIFRLAANPFTIGIHWYINDLGSVCWCIWSLLFQEVTGFVCGSWAPMNWDPWWTIWDGGLYSTSHYRTKGYYRKSFLGLHGASHSWNPLLCQARLHFLGISSITPTRNKMIRLSDFSSCAERWRIKKKKIGHWSVWLYFIHICYILH